MDSDVRIKQLVLKRMERCIVCHRTFDSDNITVISRDQGMWTMLVECTDCRARNYVAAVMNDGDPEEAQLALRRLSEHATRELHLDTQETAASEILAESGPANVDPVGAADVVDMYEFLNEFDGDFKALFRS